jgi:N-acetylglucosamine kinase-like BadF-type ATPase
LKDAYIIGVDGGGTKTDCFIFDLSGIIRAHVRGGCTNHEGFPGGMEQLSVVLSGLISDCAAKAGIAVDDISSGVFGMSGVDVLSQKQAVERMVNQIGIAAPRVFNDSFLGIKAAIQEGYGICLVNGSGNTVGGIDRRGQWLQVGGNGEISGDEGGGYYIARKVIRAVYNELFRCGSKTSMTPKLLELLEIDEPLLFMEMIYSKYMAGHISATQLLKLLFDAANEKDAEASVMLEYIGHNMALSCAGCISRLDFDEQVSVVLVGSVILKADNPIMMDTLKNELPLMTGKEICFVPLAVPPAAGAVLWALEVAGIPTAAESLRKKVISQIKIFNN